MTHINVERIISICLISCSSFVFLTGWRGAQRVQSYSIQGYPMETLAEWCKKRRKNGDHKLHIPEDCLWGFWGFWAILWCSACLSSKLREQYNGKSHKNLLWNISSANDKAVNFLVSFKNVELKLQKHTANLDFQDLMLWT